MKNLVIFIIFVSCCNVNQWDKSKQKSIKVDPIYKIIANPMTSNDTLLMALKSLSEISESARYWIDITNDSTYSEDHRRRAIFMLFNRHIHPNSITLSTLGKVLSKPNWLHLKNIFLVENLGGLIPVKFNPDDTILVVDVFPHLPDGKWENWAIYLRIEGKINVEDFYEIISSSGEKGKKYLKERKLLEFGLSPDTPEENH